MLFEIRDYHYAPERFDQYQVWAAEASRFFGDRWDLIGFWLDEGIPTRVMGSDPMELPHGSANVTWILRWDRIEQRDEAWEVLWEDPKWLEIWDRHPGFDGYRHMSVRFMTLV